MDTRHLEEFVAFSRTTNISRTARQLYITRPTLIEHLRALEAELGCQLIAHRRNQVVLTAAGKRFAEAAQAHVSSWQATQEEFRNFAENVVLATVPLRCLPWLEPLLYRARYEIQKACPSKHVEIETVDGNLARVDALESENISMTLAGFKSYLPLDRKPPLLPCPQGFFVKSDRIRLFVGRESPLFGAATVRTRDLDGQTIVLSSDIYDSWIRDDVAGQFAQRGADVKLVRKEFAEFGDYYTHYFGPNIAIVPSTIVARFGIDTREDCRFLDLEDFDLVSDFFAFFGDAYLATPNGRLLYQTMAKYAPTAPTHPT